MRSPKRLPPAAPSATASIYVRLSREAREENLSKGGMEADCRATAERLGLAVVAVHIDDGISGAVRDRSEFVAWLDDARSLRADTLVTWAVDRLTREGVNVAAMILDVLESKDVRTGRVVGAPVRLVDTRGMDSSGDDTSFRFSFVIAAEVARAERERMRERTRAAYRRLASSGRHSGGVPPFGFRTIPNPNGPGKVLAQAPSEAAFVREAAQRVLTGEPMVSVLRWANGPDGHAPRKAARWSRVALRQVLTGNAVAGRVVHTVDGRTSPVVDAHGDPVTIPAILTPDESAAVTAAIAPKSGTRAQWTRTPTRILSGILRCASCDTPLQVAVRSDGHATYRCQINQGQPGTCPRSVSVTARFIDEYVEAEFLTAWGDSPEYVRHASVAGAANIAAAEVAVAAALSDLAADATPEAFAALQAAQAVRTEATAVPQEAVVTLTPTGRTVAEAWGESDIPGRTALLATNYSTIVVRPGGRGFRTLDPRRVTMIAQPPHIAGVSAEPYRRGGAVVDG
ncbi:DNA invertase Pin-like site-specific DNA recombinase [Antricoccus suffuscus]|uniref:DNA invertase Pin-like site-specific DNA recombinase n=1 Tax=Antricoccus suffuscus TaxID=1629062 RepID=A0A2T0ZZY4_9ACTN|nr:recombinase family protein [Antricoccus suffuscus]PRZ41916.1 DNA invertase Pin-like site-specific DNA recombinase [Antricoccus suffuscus]